MKATSGGSAEHLYRGQSGRAYHDNRAAARSAESQRERAAFFSGLTTADQVVLDFGCGTGGILAALPARRRVGVEINEAAADQARRDLDEVHQTLKTVPDETVDVAVSYHALEHVADPFEQLLEIYRTLRGGGATHIIVPYESLVQRQHRQWSADDKDMHLYSWTPLTLGNLLTVAGFRVAGCKVSTMTGGGRIGRLLKFAPAAQNVVRWLKVLRESGERIQFRVSAVKEAQ